MRLPAVAIAALFACGVVLGQSSWFAQQVSSHVCSRDRFCYRGIPDLHWHLILAGCGRLASAAAVSILSWLILGVMGAGIADQPRACGLRIVGR